MTQDALRGRTIRSWNGEPSTPTPLPAETPFSIGPTSTDGLRARIRQVVEWFGGGAISDEDADAAAGVLYGTPLATPPAPTPASEDGLLLELAWGVIANAGGGNWPTESAEWQDAAVRWRDRYFARLAATTERPAEPEDKR